MTTAVSPSSPVSLGQALLYPVRVLVQTLDWVRECNRITSEYVQTSHKTDGRLAMSGLTREDIPSDIIRRSDLF